MQIDKTINRILYVPFNEDYSVDKSVQNVLTEKEFFDECFYMPDFDIEIKELLEKSENEIKAFEVDLTKEELVEKYRRNKYEKEAFFNWIDNNQDEIYCIKGDAGTGKTTFLHYLEYHYRNTDIAWDIIDMNMSIEDVKILKYKLHIPKASNVYYKSISVFIKKIVNMLFKTHNDGRIHIQNSFQNIADLINRYHECFDGYFPVIFVEEFFNGLSDLINNDFEIDKTKSIVDCSKFVFDYFNRCLGKPNHNRDEVFSDIFELLVYFNCCKDKNKRHILAFDNLERFIGTDEIYDKQLVDFITKIRHIQRSISKNSENIAQKYQVTIFMRNTSTRMFNPQQIADNFPHIVNLSEWFQSAKIIQRKIDWYRTKGINIDESERLLDIITDIGHVDDDDFRGLRSKLNMLFNHDKRVIVNILAKVLENDSNRKYLQSYDYFWKNEDNIEKSHAKFAKRIIIFRLVLNELRKDGFFINVAVARDVNERTSLGYARKILTILYEYKLLFEDGYMKLDDVITKLDANERNAIERYYVKYNKKKRSRISKVLYYMNYYDGRANNWLQFIDIQYNFPQKETRIKTARELCELIDKNHEHIFLRITSAGMAYLFFVVYSFEYFSCKSYKVAPKNYIYGDGSLPPLLCVIPTKEDIMTKSVDDILCVKIAEFVSKEAVECIKKMKEDQEIHENREKSIPFRKGLHDRYIEHWNRIINSHYGFINNYINCIKEIYKSELRNNNDFWEKYQNLEDRLEQIKKEYILLR